MNFEKCEDKNSTIGDGDKIINFSTNCGETCSSVEDNVPTNEESWFSQEVGNNFSSVVIKCEEPEMSDSDTYNTEMDSKPQILNTVNTNEQLGLVVNIKPEPFEFERNVKEESVSNQGTVPVDVDIKYEKTEMSCSNTVFFFKETIDTKEQSDFNASVKCDPLATETYVKQENEEYVVPSFSTFSDGNRDSDNNSGDDRSVSVNGKCKNKTSFICDVCNRTFNRQSKLKNHMLTHTGEKPYQYDKCNKCFTERPSLTTHQGLHSGEKPYQCDICIKSFNQFLNRSTNHKNTHACEKPYQCDICDKCFTRRNSLLIHKRLHSGEKPYQCDICNKTFNQLYHLTNHKNLHTGEKPYQCDICDKCFSQRECLKAHKRSHSGEKPYRCDICDKTFYRSSDLSNHKNTHTGVKPYQCDICNKFFTRRGSLNVHKRLHSGEKPYRCDICNKTFNQSSDLSKHKLTHKKYVAMVDKN